MFPGKSIRHRFMFLIVLVAVPLAVFDIYQASLEKDQRTVTITQDLERSALAVVGKVSDLIDSSHELLAGLSVAEEVRGGDVKACSRMLRKVGEQYVKYTNFSVVNADKFLVCSSGPLAAPIHLLNSPNINDAFATGEFAVSPFKFGVLTGKPILVFSHPILNDEKKMIGTINNGLSLTWLGKFFTSVAKLKNEHILVFDDQGTVLASHPEGSYTVGAVLKSSDITRHALQRRQHTGIFENENGRQMIAAFTSIPRIPNGAHVVSFSPLNDLQKDVVQTLLQRLVVLGLIVGVTLIFGWYGARLLLVDPIDRLVMSSEALAKGDLTARSDVAHTAGELGRLGQAFDQMAEALETRTEVMTQAIEDAESANHTKSEFLASMSHELRTPLNAILGFAQMMQFDPKAPLAPSQDEHVNSILTGGNHLLELVNGILDLSRIEADQLVVVVEDTDVDRVIAETVALCAPLAEKKSVEIFNHSDSVQPILISTDFTRFKQVLLNLLSNAINYNKVGGTVTITSEIRDQGFVRISVADTGIGIAKSEQSRVFQMFHRVGADSMVAREGTGIGLSVSKLLVERMAGRIGFDSEEGVGSTFWIELPEASNQEMIIWTDSLRVGIDALDKDHQSVVSLINRISREHVEESDVDSVIWKLIDYTRYHFRREEVVMDICGYPDTKAHKALHRDLIAQVDNLANEWRTTRDTGTLLKLRRFLRDWWVGHIMRIDTGITTYAQGRDQDIRDALEGVE